MRYTIKHMEEELRNKKTKESMKKENELEQFKVVEEQLKQIKKERELLENEKAQIKSMSHRVLPMIQPVIYQPVMQQHGQFQMPLIYQPVSQVNLPSGYASRPPKSYESVQIKSRTQSAQVSERIEKLSQTKD